MSNPCDPQTWIGNFRCSRMIECIETTVLQGSGTEEDPYRNVTYYGDKEGRLLAFSDPFHRTLQSIP